MIIPFRSPRCSLMSYVLNDTQKGIKDMVAEFARRDILPKAEELDKNRHYPQDAIKGIAAQKMTALLLPPEAGGPGLDTISYVIILEELAKAHGSLGLVLEAHNSLALYPLYALGSQKQKDEVLTPLANGDALATMALMEEGAGHNFGSWTTTAKKDGSGYVINGKKILVISGAVAEKVLVGTNGPEGVSIFILNKGSITKIEPGYVVGMNSAGLATMEFTNVKVGPDALLGTFGGARDVLVNASGLHAMGIAAVAVGVNQASLESARDYANMRVQFNETLAHFPAIQWMMTDMLACAEGARLLTHKAAALYDDKQDFIFPARLAKMVAGDGAMQSAVKCSQVHGGLGFTKEAVAERLMRDAKVLQILAGTSEAHKDFLAKKILGL